MGLDQHLTGEKFFWTNWENPEENQKRDGFQLEKEFIKLGYWRKHPDLHGYIVQQFADGKDECQDIDLDADCLIKIMQAVENKQLPKTEGFFFGTSEDDPPEKDLKILQGALDWLETEEKGVSRSIIYRASW